MSLLNDALKKAQNTHSPPPAAAAPSPADPGARPGQPVPVLHRRRPMQARTVIIAAASGAGFVALLAVAIGWSLWPSGDSEALPGEPAHPVSVPAPVVIEPFDLSSPPPAPAAAAPLPAPEPEPPPAPPEPNPHVYVFLDRVRVTGVRVSATDPKVLMNDRVFRLDDVVDRSLGVRITGISAETLTFTDAAGYVYTKDF